MHSDASASFLTLCTLIVSIYYYDFQVFPKLFTMIFYKNELAQLLDGLKHFWPCDDSFRTKFALKFTRFFILWLSLMEFVILFRILITNDFNIYCYIPDKYFVNFTTVKIAQLTYTFYIYFIVLGFDVLLITVCIYLYHQFELVQSRLQRIINLETDTKEESLAICVEYHATLLE